MIVTYFELMASPGNTSPLEWEALFVIAAKHTMKNVIPLSKVQPIIMETKLAESKDNAIGILAMLATFSQYSHHNKG